MSRIVVYDLYFRNYLYGLSVYHEFTDAFNEVNGLNNWVSKEKSMYHLTVIMVVYGYTLDRKMSMENTDQREWNPTYL